jgi:chromosome segregation ATPase
MSTRKTGEDDRYKQLDQDIEHVADEVGRLAERVKAAEAKLATLGKREADNADEIKALRDKILQLQSR